MYYCGVLSKKNILPMFPFGGMGWRKKNSMPIAASSKKIK